MGLLISIQVLRCPPPSIVELSISSLKVFRILAAVCARVDTSFCFPLPPPYNAAPSCGVKRQGETGGLLVVVTATGCALPH